MILSPLQLLAVENSASVAYMGMVDIGMQDTGYRSEHIASELASFAPPFTSGACLVRNMGSFRQLASSEKPSVGMTAFASFVDIAADTGMEDTVDSGTSFEVH